MKKAAKTRQPPAADLFDLCYANAWNIQKTFAIRFLTEYLKTSVKFARRFLENETRFNWQRVLIGNKKITIHINNKAFNTLTLDDNEYKDLFYEGDFERFSKSKATKWITQELPDEEKKEGKEEGIEWGSKNQQK